MRKRAPIRSVLLAATSLAAASLAIAGAAHAAPPAAPADMVGLANQEADEVRASQAETLKAVGLAAAAAAAVAAFVGLVGFQRLAAFFSAAGPVLAGAAEALAKAPVAAARAVGRAAASPFRFAVIAAGLALFAFTGLSVLDIEWAGGLVVGLALAVVVGIGARGTKRALARVRMRHGSGQRENKMNDN